MQYTCEVLPYGCMHFSTLAHVSQMPPSRLPSAVSNEFDSSKQCCSKCPV